MATESVPKQQKMRDFYKFAGTYRVSQDTSTHDMAVDAACFLDAAEAMVNKLIEGFGPDVQLEDQSMIFGIGHFVAMAKNLCEAVHEEIGHGAPSTATIARERMVS